METDSPVAYHGTSESRFNVDQPRNQLKLSDEEIRIFQECNKESFYYRCLPLAAASMSGVYYAAKRGLLLPHPVYGIALKLAGAGILGFVIGKFSYRRICEDKFLHMENSVLGDAIRKKRGYVLQKDEGFSSFKPTEDITSQEDQSTYYPSSDYHSSSGSLNLDMDKNIQYAGFDDRERPSTDRENQDLPIETALEKRVTSYDELRKNNREEYERQNAEPSPRKPDSFTTDYHRPWNIHDSAPVKRFNLPYAGDSSKNAYGDAWDNTKSS